MAKYVWQSAAVAILTACVPAAMASGNGDGNLMANPGFEERGPDGQPVAWRLPRGYSIDTNAPHSGAACLRYDATDPGRYLLCSAPIRLQPGVWYEIEARVRTSNVVGEDSGATVCLEWRDAEGRFLGGCYPTGVKGTTQACQTVRGITSAAVPAAAARMSVLCYLRRGMTGTAWWDDVIVRR